MDFSKEDVKVRILRKMVRWRKWGAAHTENILNGLPRHIRGKKIVKQAIKELENGGWLLSAMKTNEKHYFLNPSKSYEILKYLESNSSNLEQ